MKKIVLLGFVLLSVLLTAQFEPFESVDETPGNESFLGNESCATYNGTAYWTYLKKNNGLLEVMLAKKQNDLIEYFVVVDNQTSYTDFSKPTISISETGYINVAVYTHNGSLQLLKIFRSMDNGNTFQNIASYQIGSQAIDSNPFFSESDNIYLMGKTYDSGVFERSLASFQVFTEYETNENGIPAQSGPMTYCGANGEYFGPIHSNDDIYISEYGGWPVFHDSVTTAGQFISINGTIPYDDVFLGGYTENVDHRNIDASVLPNNAAHIGMGVDIIYMKLNGGSIQTKYGNIVISDTLEIPVYSWFPQEAATANIMANANQNWFEETDVIWTNEVTIYDTIWSTGPTLPISPYGSAYYLPDSELWIEGVLSGKLVVGTSKNVYIVDDITYANTTPGTPPDDPNNPNTTDFFGLVSEQDIVIKYKHRDPFMNNVIRSGNCNDVYLYGAYAALGLGSGTNPQDDGIFTFEYQHPHGSTPDFVALSPYTMQDTTYTFVDLHKYIFPIQDNLPANIDGFNLHGNMPVAAYFCCGYPYESDEYANSYPNNDPQNYIYPYGTDFPWYNPVWPESSEDIVFERGTIHLWGSMAQMRKGYIHRSGSDDFNHPPGNNEWDIDNFHFDGPHPSTGYDKNYHYDSRLNSVEIPNYPTLNYDVMNFESLNLYKSDNNGFSFEETHSFPISSEISNYHFDTKCEKIVIAYQLVNDDYLHLIYTENNLNYEVYALPIIDGTFKKVALANDVIILLISYPNQDVVAEFDPISLDFNVLGNYEPSNLTSLVSNPAGSVIYIQESANTTETDFDFNYTNTNSILGGMYNWQSQFSNINQEYSDLGINIISDDQVILNLLFAEENAVENWGNLHSSTGFLDDFVGIVHYDVIESGILLSNYPNPFNPSTTISFNVTQSSDFATIEIYNLKGQKVKTFPIYPSTDQPINSVTWNGTDNDNKPVSSGIYFYKLKAGQLEKTKKMLLLK
ncbi:MAG: T9SS type A sorting domain-containing protein [Candidatus Cloacimonetes bacterium]|nr:T9SS type A sorting domain-containing protein [Candidatus Cloacimonadota bacterium]MCF7813399.1 T9SS type A sorting domain-containing protein [Candidatus Cloacimonadota bacterium]MCF7867476.1 T9SS type A sorting domain-containing protein [Candidatus Cloacimonadota bacterium]MCF7883020.1 T9SS type A sorting domain-containing protein [Candidatus Cloacimonadota bacterium]